MLLQCVKGFRSENHGIRLTLLMNPLLDKSPPPATHTNANTQTMTLSSPDTCTQIEANFSDATCQTLVSFIIQVSVVDHLGFIPKNYKIIINYEGFVYMP